MMMVHHIRGFFYKEDRMMGILFNICALIICVPAVVFAGSGAMMAGSYYSGKTTIPALRTYQPAAKNFPGLNTPIFGAGVRYSPVSSKAIYITNATYNSNNLSINTSCVNSYTKKEASSGRIFISLNTGKLNFSTSIADGAVISYSNLIKAEYPVEYNLAVTRAKTWARGALYNSSDSEKATWTAMIAYLESLK